MLSTLTDNKQAIPTDSKVHPTYNTPNLECLFVEANTTLLVFHKLLILKTMIKTNNKLKLKSTFPCNHNLKIYLPKTIIKIEIVVTGKSGF